VPDPLCARRASNGLGTHLAIRNKNCAPLLRLQKGTALIFPTATLDGLADERYLHSGEPVIKGDKWIVGTWLMEAERTDGADVRKAIEELWKLEARS